jgi:cytidylate kinase
VALVTISRQEACGGEAVAAAVARRLGFRLVDRPLMRELLYSYDLLAALGRFGLPEAPGPGSADAEELAVHEATEGIIHHLAFRENIVLLGYCGQFLFKGYPGALHVRLIASLEYRLGFAERQGTFHSQAVLLRKERDRRRLVRKRCGADLTRPEHYDLVLRMDGLGADGAAEIIERAVITAGIATDGQPEKVRSHGREAGARELPLDPLPRVSAPKVGFANQSEEQFAKVLDFYEIPWQYEPETFPIEWWPDGRVKSSFSPDFYLPEMDTYLELTTMKQALVTKKNKKIRLFREVYPDRKLLIFYGRDFRKLAQKYGLE